MSYRQALRALFRNASYSKIGAVRGEVIGKPPALDKIPRLPRVAQLVKANRLPRVPGRRMLGPLLMYSVRLDKLAYYGLLRTMYHEDMTRQEAARFLNSGINPKG